MHVRHFFIGGKDLGFNQIRFRPDLGEARSEWLLCGMVYVSPISGNVWATLPVLRDDKVTRFFCITSPAIGEPGWLETPAGTLLNASMDLLEQLPPKVLMRELLLHLDYYEKKGISNGS